MDFSRLYWFRQGAKHGAFRGEWVVENLDSYAIARAEQPPPSLSSLRHCMGGTDRIYDLIGTGYPELELLSPRAVQVLHDAGFTGWSSFPVEITGKKSLRVEGYECLVITGRCGPVDWSKGKHVRRPPPVPQGQGYDAWLGVYFDPETWDGSDFFMPEDMTLRTVTERVKVALEKAKITNVRFTPLTEFERSWPV